MPTTTKTTNLISAINHNIIFKNVELEYNNKYDYYSINIKQLIQQFDKFMQELEVLYAIIDNIKYYFSNVFVEKSGLFANIILIFEKSRNTAFYNDIVISGIFKDIDIEHIKNEYVDFYKIDMNNIRAENILMNSYLNGTFIETNNKPMYFSSIILKRRENAAEIDVFMTYQVVNENSIMFLTNKK